MCCRFAGAIPEYECLSARSQAKWNVYIQKEANLRDLRGLGNMAVRGRARAGMWEDKHQRHSRPGEGRPFLLAAGLDEGWRWVLIERVRGLG